MSDIVSKNPLVLNIVDGKAPPELLEFLVSRQLPFTEEEYLESLVHVLGDPRFKERALEQLDKLSESAKESYVQKKEASRRVAYFVLLEALQKRHIGILNRIAQNLILPVEFALRIAAEAPAGVLEIMVENQIRMIGYPEIMAAMEKNPECSHFVRGKIEEIREFYLKEQKVEAIPESAARAAVAEVLAEEAPEAEAADEQLVEKQTMNLLQRINQLTVSERIKMALTGTRMERTVLLRDSNRMVYMAVVDSPKMTDDEALSIAQNRSLPGEIIGKIASNRFWTRSYPIMLELVKNPKTPVGLALGFMSKLHNNDLYQLLNDRNISPVVRSAAINVNRTRNRVKE